MDGHTNKVGQPNQGGYAKRVLLANRAHHASRGRRGHQDIRAGLERRGGRVATVCRGHTGLLRLREIGWERFGLRKRQQLPH